MAHAEIFSNRVRKRFRHLSKRFKRMEIDCFRLYDWDIPEVRAVVDWYAGHIVIAEYERLQTGPDWLVHMANAVGEALGVPPEKVHMKRRQTRKPGTQRYNRMDSQGERITVRERDLTLLVSDINRDHRALIQSVLSIMAPGSTVFFSSNHQRFESRLDTLGVRSVVELTLSTIPEDYRNRKIHRCWKIDT